MSSDILVIIYRGDSLMVFGVCIYILVSPVTRFVTRSASRSRFICTPFSSMVTVLGGKVVRN